MANARIHGTTHWVPWYMLAEERPRLGKLPDRPALSPYLREERSVSRDCFVRWEGSRIRKGAFKEQRPRTWQNV